MKGEDVVTAARGKMAALRLNSILAVRKRLPSSRKDRERSMSQGNHQAGRGKKSASSDPRAPRKTLKREYNRLYLLLKTCQKGLWGKTSLEGEGGKKKTISLA